jgi:hypothetical protein
MAYAQGMGYSILLTMTNLWEDLVKIKQKGMEHTIAKT